MNLHELITRMNANAQTIRQLVSGFSVEQAQWKPDSDTWSVVEVMNHLYDEERADFRARLLRAWELPPMGADFTGDFPYDAQDITAALAAFLTEREQSLAWLKTLNNPAWDIVVQIHDFEITTGQVMASWAAHDILHMRQLVELHYAQMQRQTDPYLVRYAGEW